MSDELERLEHLYRTGALTEAEFAQAKARLLSPPPLPSGHAAASYPVDNIEQQTRTWAVLLHLSQFAGYVAPVAGFLAPILIWQIMKNDLPGIDAHGRNVVNWIISSLLYWVAAIILCLVVVGIPLLIGLGIVALIFPIVGAIKALYGETWKYPLTISFF